MSELSGKADSILRLMIIGSLNHDVLSAPGHAIRYHGGSGDGTCHLTMIRYPPENFTRMECSRLIKALEARYTGIGYIIDVVEMAVNIIKQAHKNLSVFCVFTVCK